LGHIKTIRYCFACKGWFCRCLSWLISFYANRWQWKYGPGEDEEEEEEEEEEEQEEQKEQEGQWISWNTRLEYEVFVINLLEYT